MIDLDFVLRYEQEVIVPVRGRDFLLWRDYDGAIKARTNHETHRFVGMTPEEIWRELDDYRPGSWTP